jgi:tRNA (guanosine-2'-O-)-methyltransferase
MREVSGMNMKQELYKYLSQFVLERRLELFEQNVSYRTRYITVVLEDAYQAQNASAVLRTCDCLGIQDVHFIENKNKFNLDKEVTLGSDKWLNLHSYKKNANNSIFVINHLKSLGYRIVATSPHKNDVSLFDFDLGKGKIALLFGTELTGLSDVAIQNSDEYIYIPMFGFTESYNLSVSVALILHYFVRCLHNIENLDWHLTDDERIEVLLSWLRKSIRKVDIIEKKFLASDNS